MKAQNLLILHNNKIRVPDFKVINSVDESETVDEFIKDNIKYAVRSSCVLEDSETESHAGEFKTLLNVGKDKIKESILEVFNSYNGKSGRVIVQEMVDADLSGVIFTANPVGILNEIVIVVGKGLGENIVEDKVDTTTYYYNTNDKKYYFSGKDILTDESVENLTYQAAIIKDIFNEHTDIEFAIKDNIIYILQARPITTFKQDAKRITLDNSNIVESYPGISLPLTQDFVKEIYYRVFRSLLLRLTQDDNIVNQLDDDLQHMVECCNGRMYYNMANWYSVLKLLPFDTKLISIWQDMLGVEHREVTSTFKVSKETKRKIIKQSIRLLKTCQEDMVSLDKEFKRKVPIYLDLIDKCTSVQTLLGAYKIILDNLVGNWDITLINDMYTFLFTALSGKRAREHLANVRNLESLKPVLDLNNIVKLYKNGGDTHIYRVNVASYIEKYGDRCVGELKLETQTYRTDPDSLHGYIKKAEYIEDVIKTNNSALKDNLFTVRAKGGIRNRETSRINRTRIFGLARDIMLRIGEILEINNSIDSYRDVFYLHFNELTEERDYRDLVKLRKEQYKQLENIPNFSRLEFLDMITEKGLVSIHCKSIGGHTEFFGIGSSIGKVVGEVIKIDNPSTDVDVTGKIIVTESTDPGWVFLIKNCLGIIAERGSMLSHTAIITRELGKPSIVNVKDIMTHINTGDIIELDAYKGIVKIMKD